MTLARHSPLITVVSPYHLTTREPAAMASLLLADQVVTLLPSPLDASHASLRREAERAAREVPRYRRLMEAWSWMEPLWRAGLISGDDAGDDALDDMRSVCDRLESDPSLAPLRGLAHERLFERGARYLDLIAGDMLKGGPDPGLLVPVAAGLDRFASRRALAVARSEPVSAAQRSERRLARRAFAFAMPVLTQADAGRILEAREALDEHLRPLRAPIGAMLANGAEPDTRAIARAAERYADAFAHLEPRLTRSDDPYDPRTIARLVGVTGLRLPADAVLTSSVAAAEAYLGGCPGAGEATATLAPEAGTVLTLVVTPIGVRR